MLITVFKTSRQHSLPSAHSIFYIHFYIIFSSTSRSSQCSLSHRNFPCHVPIRISVLFHPCSAHPIHRFLLTAMAKSTNHEDTHYRSSPILLSLSPSFIQLRIFLRNSFSKMHSIHPSLNVKDPV